MLVTILLSLILLILSTGIAGIILLLIITHPIIMLFWVLLIVIYIIFSFLLLHPNYSYYVRMCIKHYNKNFKEYFNKLKNNITDKIRGAIWLE